jgi:hypothetical protein
VSRRQEKEKEKSSWFEFNHRMTQFYAKFVALPIAISLLYAIAILFPPEARAKAPAILWADGAITGKLSLCPENLSALRGFFRFSS